MLDRSTWSMRSILGGSCLWNKMELAVTSRDSRQTISRCEGRGHYLYSAKLARITGRLNVAVMSEARSVLARPSIEKWMIVGWGTRLDVMV